MALGTELNVAAELNVLMMSDVLGAKNVDRKRDSASQACILVFYVVYYKAYITTSYRLLQSVIEEIRAYRKKRKNNGWLFMIYEEDQLKTRIAIESVTGCWTETDLFIFWNGHRWW